MSIEWFRFFFGGNQKQILMQFELVRVVHAHQLQSRLLHCHCTCQHPNHAKDPQVGRAFIPGPSVWWMRKLCYELNTCRCRKRVAPLVWIIIPTYILLYCKPPREWIISEMLSLVFMERRGGVWKSFFGACDLDWRDIDHPTFILCRVMLSANV